MTKQHWILVTVAGLGNAGCFFGKNSKWFSAHFWRKSGSSIENLRGERQIIASRKAQAWLRLSDMNILSEPVVDHPCWVFCPVGQREAGGRVRISCRVPIKESVLTRESALPQWGQSAQPENLSLGWDRVLGDSDLCAFRFRLSLWSGRLLPACPARGEDRN